MVLQKQSAVSVCVCVCLCIYMYIHTHSHILPLPFNADSGPQENMTMTDPVLVVWHLISLSLALYRLYLFYVCCIVWE